MKYYLQGNFKKIIFICFFALQMSMSFASNDSIATHSFKMYPTNLITGQFHYTTEFKGAYEYRKNNNGYRFGAQAAIPNLIFEIPWTLLRLMFDVHIDNYFGGGGLLQYNRYFPLKNNGQLYVGGKINAAYFTTLKQTTIRFYGSSSSERNHSLPYKPVLLMSNVDVVLGYKLPDEPYAVELDLGYRYNRGWYKYDLGNIPFPENGFYGYLHKPFRVGVSFVMDIGEYSKGRKHRKKR